MNTHTALTYPRRVCCISYMLWLASSNSFLKQHPQCTATLAKERVKSDWQTIPVVTNSVVGSTHTKPSTSTCHESCCVNRMTACAHCFDVQNLLHSASKKCMWWVSSAVHRHCMCRGNQLVLRPTPHCNPHLPVTTIYPHSLVSKNNHKPCAAQCTHNNSQALAPAAPTMLTTHIQSRHKHKQPRLRQVLRPVFTTLSAWVTTCTSRHQHKS